MPDIKQHWKNVPKPIRQSIVGVIGVLVIAGGIAMLVLPGPGWATIFLGLAILATEFNTAHRAKAYVQRRAGEAAAVAKQKLLKKPKR